jgi:outer membrane protein insertion porin family/translocation and assembly module TamA
MSSSFRRFRLLAYAFAAPLLAGLAAAQEPATPAEAPVEAESPLVKRVTFQGAASLPEKELRAAVLTQQTRCRGTFLLGPICKLTQLSALIEREYLERSELPKDELRLEVLYFRRGYREASARATVQPLDEGVEVIFSITEGAPTVVSSFQLTQTQEILSARQIRRAMLPGEGEPLDIARLEAGLFELESRLGERGYLDAEASDEVDVAADLRTASVSVVIDPGRRSTVAALDIEGNQQIEDRTIEEAVRLRSGRVLRSGDLVASQRSLYESNLFHEARVVLPPQPDSAKHLEITVREAPPRSARVGGGFNTADYVQVEGRFTHYNWLGRGRRLDASVTVGNLLASSLAGSTGFRVPLSTDDEFLRPTWQAGIELMQPGFVSAEHRAGVALFTHRRIIPGVVIDEGYGISTSITRRLDFQSPLSLEYHYESTVVLAGDLYFCANYGICDLASISALRGRHRLSPIGLGLFSDHADDPLAPRSGYRLRFDLEHASAATISDFRYNRVSGEVSGYLPLGLMKRRVLAGHLRAGWVAPLAGTAVALGFEDDETAVLHPRRRFFAGGSRSVRGFGENQLGPRVLTIDPLVLTGGPNPVCTSAQIDTGECDASSVPSDLFTPRPVGGHSLLEASVEFRFPLVGSVQGAAFVDAGVVRGGAEGTPVHNVAAVTPGFGIRYDSPVAPIRVDLGFRPRLVETLPVLTEAVNEFRLNRLVRLDVPKVYDPIGESVGAWRRLMSHLRLHVSIGEAF